MNRSEKRAQNRKMKGCYSGAITQHREAYTPYLDYIVKAGKDNDMKRDLRSQQVPGY